MDFYSIREPETGDLVVIQGDPQTAHPLTMVLTAEGIREMTASRIEHPLYIDWIRFLTGYQDKLESLTSLLSQDAYISSLYTKLTSSMAAGQEEPVIPAVIKQKSESESEQETDAEAAPPEYCWVPGQTEKDSESVPTDEPNIDMKGKEGGSDSAPMDEPTIEVKAEKQEGTVEPTNEAAEGKEQETPTDLEEHQAADSSSDLQKICDIGKSVVDFFCEIVCGDKLKLYCQSCDKTVKQWVGDYLTSVEHSSHVDELQSLLEPLQWGSSTAVSGEEAEEIHSLLFEMMEEAKYSGSREELERIVDPIYYLVCTED